MPVNREHAFAGGVVYPHPKVRLSFWLRGIWSQPIVIGKLIIGHYLNPARSRVAAAWRQIERTCRFDSSLRIGPNAWCSNYSGGGRTDEIQIERQVILRGVIRIEYGGKVKIADGVYLGDDVIISSACEIEIGAGSLIGHGVHIFDNDSHPLRWQERVAQNAAYRLGQAVDAPKVGCAPVRICDHVWIGFSSFIAKGVTIGDRSVVAANSVVTKNVPEGCLVAGNPARIIRYLES